MNLSIFDIMGVLSTVVVPESRFVASGALLDGLGVVAATGVWTGRDFRGEKKTLLPKHCFFALSMRLVWAFHSQSRCS